MAAPIDFYFDFSSPYGFLAAQRIEALAALYGRSVDWHPVLLGVIFKETGAAPLTQIPLKGDYSRRDIPRSARFHGIDDFRMPSRFPIPTQAAARIVLALKRPTTRSRPRSPSNSIAPISSRTRHFRSGRCGRRAGRGRRGCRYDARGDRRSEDQGSAEGRGRAGDEGRRVRLTVRHRRRGAFLGPRPVSAARALACERGLLMSARAESRRVLRRGQMLRPDAPRLLCDEAIGFEAASCDVPGLSTPSFAGRSAGRAVVAAVVELINGGLHGRVHAALLRAIR